MQSNARRCCAIWLGSSAYGGTLELIADQLPLLGIPSHFLLGGELDQLESLLAGGARLVLFETPSNPTLEIFDIATIAEQADGQPPANNIVTSEHIF